MSDTTDTKWFVLGFLVSFSLIIGFIIFERLQYPDWIQMICFVGGIFLLGFVMMCYAFKDVPDEYIPSILPD